MSPFVDLQIDLQWFFAAGMLRNDDFGPALVQVSQYSVRIKSLVGDHRVELDPVEQRSDADSVEPVSGHKLETNQVPESVGQRQDLGCHTALGLADGLILSPPFAP